MKTSEMKSFSAEQLRDPKAMETIDDSKNKKSFECRGTGSRIRLLVCHNDRRLTQLSNQHGPSCCMPNLVRTDFTQYQEHVIKTDRLQCDERAFKGRKRNAMETAG
jgi:hypothetical protein